MYIIFCYIVVCVLVGTGSSLDRNRYPHGGEAAKGGNFWMSGTFQYDSDEKECFPPLRKKSRPLSWFYDLVLHGFVCHAGRE